MNAMSYSQISANIASLLAGKDVAALVASNQDDHLLTADDVASVLSGARTPTSTDVAKFSTLLGVTVPEILYAHDLRAMVDFHADSAETARRQVQAMLGEVDRLWMYGQISAEAAEEIRKARLHAIDY